MFRHLFKLLWNKRKHNFLFLTEILISFLVTFAVFSYLTYYYQNYKRPIGLDYQRVWAIGYDNGTFTKDRDSLDMFYKNLTNSLKAMPQVEEVSLTSGNFPYSESFISTGLTHKGKSFNMVSNFAVGADYNKVWNIGLTEGRWFLPEDAVSKNKTILINETLKNQMFGKGPAAGKLIGDFDDANKMKVIGVVKDIKTNGDFAPVSSAMFTKLDTAEYKYTRTILLKVSASADATFEGTLYKFMANSTKGAVEIRHVDEMRDARNERTYIPMIIFSILACFLIINVALGLFGVLWYNINKRKSEIGLRRAIGASGSSVSAQLVYEALILATMSLVLGCFFAIQFPLLNVFDIPSNVYLISILLSITFIYILVLACSLYPGRQAAAIHPAVALHEE